MIAASVAPLRRWISARIFAPLLPARGAVALAAFFGLADLAVFLALAAPFFWVAPFGATLRGGAATVRGVSGGSTLVFCVEMAHDDSSLGFGGKASERKSRLSLHGADVWPV
jgi:hypothetical protein